MESRVLGEKFELVDLALLLNLLCQELLPIPFRNFPLQCPLLGKEMAGVAPCRQIRTINTRACVCKVLERAPTGIRPTLMRESEPFSTNGEYPMWGGKRQNLPLTLCLNQRHNNFPDTRSATDFTGGAVQPIAIP